MYTIISITGADVNNRHGKKSLFLSKNEHRSDRGVFVPDPCETVF